MAQVKPFTGIRYAAGSGDLPALTAPPYDVITPDERDRLERAAPHNVVRLTLGRDEPDDDAATNKYTRAATLLDRWLKERVLVRDDTERFYLYEQTVTVNGEERRQRGFLCATALDGSSILPHERTMPGPVADRMALMRATRANLEPILCLYEGQDGAAREATARAAEAQPLADFTTDDGIGHRLWGIEDPEEVGAIQKALAPLQLVVADGHHRLRTAEAYRDERRAADGPGPWDAILVLAVDTAWAGPLVLPIHRVLTGVRPEGVLARMAKTFHVEKSATRSTDELERELARRRVLGPTFVLMDRRRAWFARLTDDKAAAAAMPAERSGTWRSLDVSLLHAFVFETLLDGLPVGGPGFVHSAAEADRALTRGEASLAVLLAPTPVESVTRIALEGEAMPPKSTYFFPKPRSGTVMRLLD